MTSDDVADPKLAIIISLFYRKGHKQDMKRAKHIQLNQLDNAYSVVDPVKMFIIYAIRTGDVPETDWNTLIHSMSRRPSKTLIWSDPTLPVFRAYGKNGACLLSDAAPANQQLQNLREAADLVGLIEPLWTHDLRRGAAQDIANLRSPIPGHSDEPTRRALGHTHKA
ncbi:hypothetical protein LTR66_013382 [Elasticomyces elasticus]|nr:hypothetical protein LTR66_013382 [Elasticomyces elasticus]